MLALGVVNPASSGLGGGGFALYYRASDHSLTFLDFRERAPRAASRTMFEVETGDAEGPASSASQLGGLAAGVPGEPAGIEALVERFGKLSLREVIAPALRLAEQGFEVSEALGAMGSAFAVQLRKDSGDGPLGSRDRARPCAVRAWRVCSAPLPNKARP